MFPGGSPLSAVTGSGIPPVNGGDARSDAFADGYSYTASRSDFGNVNISSGGGGVALFFLILIGVGLWLFLKK